LPQHAVAGAILPSSIAYTRVGATLVQPEWIGCDLGSYRMRLAETAVERLRSVLAGHAAIQPPMDSLPMHPLRLTLAG
jgi:hypothetical protein